MRRFVGPLLTAGCLSRLTVSILRTDLLGPALPRFVTSGDAIRASILRNGLHCPRSRPCGRSMRGVADTLRHLSHADDDTKRQC
jgi:hypothetical protein